MKSLKEFNLLESLEKGIIPVIADAKCEPAARILASPGFSNICDWHSAQCATKRAGGLLLKKFDAESEKKWKVRFEFLFFAPQFNAF